MTTVLITLLAVRLFCPAADVDEVKTFTLDNGMKFLVLEDHSIPNANMYLFYKVGSRNEYPGITGLSHFFEHMMFNGAKKYGPKEFDRVMEAHGGANNAYTSENLTVYTNFFPSDSLEIIFDLEADRIANLSFDDEMIESERGVILSERNTYMENSNIALLGEQVQATAFIAHPYQWSVLGWESDIRNWSKADLQRYFHTYYAPNNCLVAVVGDVKVDAVKSLAEKYFEPIPAQDPPRQVHTVEPEQRGERRIFVKKKVSSPNVMIVYHTPETGTADSYVLVLLDNILSSGRSSRLYSTLVDQKQKATAVYTSLDFSFDPYMFTIYTVCAGESAAGDLEAEIYAILDDIAQNGVTEKELEKAKNQKTMEFYRAMQTIDGKANTLGDFELFLGDYKKLFELPQEFDKITVEDIKRVAGKYFVKANRTVGILASEEEGN
jgi:zinc protease